MQSIKIGEITVSPGTSVVMEGMPSPRLYTVLRGMGLRYKTLEDGRRQVVNFALPGDFIGLQAVLIGDMQQTVEATTEMTLCIFDKAALWKIYASQNERAYALTWISAAEEHFLSDALATLGQRDASERVAWALVHLRARLVALGLEEDGWVPLPYRQQDLADALGLSLVHTNKTLARLRGQNLAVWSGGRLRIPDLDRLREVAVMDTSRQRPRPLF